jgi:hypothetical protein
MGVHLMDGLESRSAPPSLPLYKNKNGITTSITPLCFDPYSWTATSPRTYACARSASRPESALHPPGPPESHARQCQCGSRALHKLAKFLVGRYQGVYCATRLGVLIPGGCAPLGVTHDLEAEDSMVITAML